MRDTMTITVYGTDDEGHDFEEDIEVPTRWEICSTCRGNGTHVNRNIDGHGIGAEEWENDWDDDSREAYFRGDYDVACEAKCSDGKVRVVDIDACTPEQRKAVEAWEKQEDEAAIERYHDMQTRRAEDGYRW